MTENKTTIEKPHKRRKTTQKAPINTEMLENANRRKKTTGQAQKPPHTTNAKPATARRQQKKYIKPPSHETARSARGCPEPPKPIFTAERHINGRNGISESTGAARTAPNGKEEERI